MHKLTFNINELVKYYPASISAESFRTKTQFDATFYPDLNSPLVERRRITDGSKHLNAGKIQLFDPTNALTYYENLSSLTTGMVNVNQSPINQCPSGQIWAIQGVAIDPRFNAASHGQTLASVADILTVLYGSNIAVNFYLGNNSNRKILSCFLEQVGSISAVDGFITETVRTPANTSAAAVIDHYNTLRLANKVSPIFDEPKVLIENDTFSLSLFHVDAQVTLQEELYVDATILRQWWMKV